MLTILGGGYIACELAHFFGSLGTKINVVQRRDVLLPNEDEDISKKITEVFSKKYNVYTGYQTSQVQKKNNIFHVITNNSSGKLLDLESDQLLVVTGRLPNTDTLDLEKTGIKVNEKGYVITMNFLKLVQKEYLL